MFVLYTTSFDSHVQRSPEDSPQISGNYRDQRGQMSTSMSTHSMKVGRSFNALHASVCFLFVIFLQHFRVVEFSSN